MDELVLKIRNEPASREPFSPCNLPRLFVTSKRLTGCYLSFLGKSTSKNFNANVAVNPEVDVIKLFGGNLDFP